MLVARIIDSLIFHRSTDLLQRAIDIAPYEITAALIFNMTSIPFELFNS